MTYLSITLLKYHVFKKYLLNPKASPEVLEYICEHIGESDIKFIIRMFRSSNKGELMVFWSPVLGK